MENMQFKFIEVKEKVTGEFKDKYIVKSTKKEISKNRVIALLIKGGFGSFRQLAFSYKNKKFYYGQKRFLKFEDILKEIARNSKRKNITLFIYEDKKPN